MRTLVATFSYNRPNLLRLCFEWLARGITEEFDLQVFDDASESETVQGYLDQLMVQGVRVWRTGSSLPRNNYHERAARLAERRRAAVDFFLESAEYDFLMLKDDDVLTTCQTVKEAVEDFSFLQTTDFADIGALTLHGISTHGGYTKVGDKVFAELRITGEANVIFSRPALMAIGNHLGPTAGGFADTQFEALRARGFRYYDRVYPPYKVQHLGIGPDSSSVHRQERMPVWNQELYKCTYRRASYRQTISVQRFDTVSFQNTALKLGAEKAAGLLLCHRSADT